VTIKSKQLVATDLFRIYSSSCRKCSFMYCYSVGDCLWSDWAGR